MNNINQKNFTNPNLHSLKHNNYMSTNQDLGYLQNLLQETIGKFQNHLITCKDELIHNSQSLLQMPAQNPEQFISNISSKFQKMGYFIDQLLKQSVDVLSLCFKNNQTFIKHNIETEEAISKHTNVIHHLREQVATSHSKIQEKEQLINELQDKILILSYKQEQAELNFHTEHKQIKQKFKSELQALQLDLQAVQQLKEDNNQIQRSLMSALQSKKQLDTIITIKNTEILELEAQVSKYNDLLDWEGQKKLQSELNFEEQTQKINCLEQQIESLNEVLKNPFEQLTMQQIQYFIPPEEDELIVKKDSDFERILENQGKSENFQDDQIRPKILLSEQTNGIELNEYYKFNLLQVKKPGEKKAISMNNISEPGQTVSKMSSMMTHTVKNLQKKLKLPPLDPYYCHFTLLSQSVKIRQNNEKFYNIDIKPYYKIAVVEKIPMHEWEEWILNQMLQISQNIEDLPKTPKIEAFDMMNQKKQQQ